MHAHFHTVYLHTYICTHTHTGGGKDWQEGRGGGEGGGEGDREGKGDREGRRGAYSKGNVFAGAGRPKLALS